MPWVTYADFLRDAKVGESQGLARATDNIFAVTTVVFPVSECERVSADKAQLWVDPFRRGMGVNMAEDVRAGIARGEVVTYRGWDGMRH